MSSTNPKPTIAIFGATGGTGLSVLKNCLAAGHTVNVLARTPSKLSTLSSQYPNLHIIKGDIHTLSTVKETLLSNGAVVDVVVSAIGMVFQRQGLSFASPDTTICATGTKNILSALQELETEKTPFPNPQGPKIILLSTTGISHTRDIPLAMIPLYHWLLSTPHADKRKMEELVVASGRRWVLVRPSLLFDGKAKGMSAVRTGIEVPGEQKTEHAVGYTIRREDVGGWIFEECVKGSGEKWLGKCVSLTY